MKRWTALVIGVALGSVLGYGGLALGAQATVANTLAELLNKTITVTDGSYTITGTWRWGTLYLSNLGTLKGRNAAGSAEVQIAQVDASDTVVLGNSANARKDSQSMAAPSSLSNGDAWLESNTSAITGASAALKARLNGATVFVAPSIRATGRSTAQTAAVATVSTFTVGSSDASFEVSADVLVTTATTHAFTATCAYTDEGNTARTLTLSFTLVAGGTLVTSVANGNGTVPYMGVPQHLRAKAGTTITVATTGTFTTVVYNVEGVIRQLA